MASLLDSLGAVCPACAALCEPGAPACGRCGTPTASDGPAPRLAGAFSVPPLPPGPPPVLAPCTACGVKLPPAARACPRCGQPGPFAP